MKRLVTTFALAVTMCFGLTGCKQGEVNNTPVEDNSEQKTDSINSALLNQVKAEPKVKDAVITDAKVLYISALSDGTNRSGYASYFCDMAKESNADIKAVKIVEFGTTNSPDKDNAYGKLLGETTCQ